MSPSVEAKHSLRDAGIRSGMGRKTRMRRDSRQPIAGTRIGVETPGAPPLPSRSVLRASHFFWIDGNIRRRAASHNAFRIRLPLDIRPPLALCPCSHDGALRSLRSSTNANEGTALKLHSSSLFRLRARGGRSAFRRRHSALCPAACGLGGSRKGFVGAKVRVGSGVSRGASASSSPSLRPTRDKACRAASSSGRCFYGDSHPGIDATRKPRLAGDCHFRSSLVLSLRLLRMCSSGRTVGAPTSRHSTNGRVRRC